MRIVLNQCLVLGFTLAGFAYGARGIATLDSTARSLYFMENPRAELKTQKTLDAVAGIKEELQTLLDQQVVMAKHEEFYLPDYFAPGVISIRLQDATMAALKGSIDKNGVLDVSGSIGIPSLDALNRKWNITKYVREYPSSTYLKVVFDVGINPNFVADTFAAASEVKWALPSQLSFIGGGVEVRRISSASRGRNHMPTVYVLAIGWGDCPAGCMAIHRRYFEVRKYPEGVKVVSVGEAGAPLSPQQRAEYYK